MCLIIIKRSILEAFQGSIPKSQSARKFLIKFEQFFTINEKAEVINLLAKLISMKYKGKRNIRKYIMKMSNLASNQFGEDLLMHLVLISFLTHFGQFKVNDNT
ncbi:hypothetical protein CR513_34395, partial [Mucuna pruriens]